MGLGVLLYCYKYFFCKDLYTQASLVFFQRLHRPVEVLFFNSNEFRTFY